MNVQTRTETSRVLAGAAAGTPFVRGVMRRVVVAGDDDVEGVFSLGASRWM